MKKFIKTATLVIVTYSFAELVTFYRIDPEGRTFKEYVKYYLKKNAKDTVRDYKRNHRMAANGDFMGAVRLTKQDLFPNK